MIFINLLHYIATSDQNLETVVAVFILWEHNRADSLTNVKLK